MTHADAVTGGSCRERANMYPERRIRAMFSSNTESEPRLIVTTTFIRRTIDVQVRTALRGPASLEGIKQLPCQIFRLTIIPLGPSTYYFWVML